MSKTNKKQKKKKTKSVSKERKELEDSNNKCTGGKDRNKRKRRGSSVSDHDRKKVLDGNAVSVKISGISSTLQFENKTSRAKASEAIPKKKRRKDEKKKNRQEYEVLINQHDVNPDVAAGLQDDDTNDDNELEGSVISNDVFVLIDRKKRKIYSSTELLQNGERKPVGKLDDNGRVVLFQEELKEKNSLHPTQDLISVPAKNHNDNDDPSISFPFKVEPDDHCESPLVAYKDVSPLLESHKRLIRKKLDREVSIYDPYYCNGQVMSILKSLGFPEVYNKKEDCYRIWKDPSRYPNYDIFITNPPYSGLHIERLMQHVTWNKKPWMLLMPSFVHKKDYFKRLTINNGQYPIYLVPKKRYIYQPPPNFREKKASDTHKKSSPFVSMWYIWGGSTEKTDEWYRLLSNQQSMTYDVARSKSALRDLRRKK